MCDKFLETYKPGGTDDGQKEVEKLIPNVKISEISRQYAIKIKFNQNMIFPQKIYTDPDSIISIVVIDPTDKKISPIQNVTQDWKFNKYLLFESVVTPSNVSTDEIDVQMSFTHVGYISQENNQYVVLKIVDPAAFETFDGQKLSGKEIQ